MAIRCRDVIRRAEQLLKKNFWTNDQSVTLSELETLIDEELSRQIARCVSLSLRPPPGERCYTFEIVVENVADELVSKARQLYRFAGWTVLEMKKDIITREGLFTDEVKLEGLRISLCESPHG